MAMAALSRRDFLWQYGGGLGGIALASLLGKDGLLAQPGPLRGSARLDGPATFMQNTGFVLPGFPAMGAWINYGLGSMTNNLPAFVVIPDSRGYAPNGPANWSAAFLPASAQGTTIRPSDRNPIFDLFP